MDHSFSIQSDVSTLNKKFSMLKLEYDYAWIRFCYDSYAVIGY
jgi:hypothetical protein